MIVDALLVVLGVACAEANNRGCRIKYSDKEYLATAKTSCGKKGKKEAKQGFWAEQVKASTSSDMNGCLGLLLLLLMKKRADIGRPAPASN